MKSTETKDCKILYPWCTDVVDSIRDRLGPTFSVSFEKVFGEPEAYVTWPGCFPVTVILSLGEEMSGERYAFATFGAQGAGGIQKDFDLSDGCLIDFEDEVILAVRTFRMIVDAIAKNAKGKK